jgi:hypothetical protein
VIIAALFFFKSDAGFKNKNPHPLQHIKITSRELPSPQGEGDKTFVLGTLEDG